MRINEVTNSITFKAGATSKFSVGELREVASLINAGGQIVSHMSANDVKSAKSLAVAISDGHIVAIAALKPSMTAYKNRVFENAGVPSEAKKYNSEIGWLMVSPEFRGQGLGKTLTQKLLATAGSTPIYATVRANNKASLGLLTGVGFSPLGKPFKGLSGNMIVLLAR